MISLREETWTAWRDERHEYLIAVREHNDCSPIQLKPVPLRSRVASSLWRTVSKRKLLPHHRTGVGEEPNHEQVLNFFLLLGEYQRVVVRAKTTQRQMLETVVFLKGRRATNLDRWYSYLDRYDKVLRTIAREQWPIAKHHARLIRDAVRPEKLRRMVEQCMQSGVDPETETFLPWMRGAYSSVELTKDLVERLVEYLDAQARAGFYQEQWSSAGGGAVDKVAGRCFGFGTAGGCRYGDRCRFQHT